jgi:hypothetical protein
MDNGEDDVRTTARTGHACCSLQSEFCYSEAADLRGIFLPYLVHHHSTPYGPDSLIDGVSARGKTFCGHRTLRSKEERQESGKYPLLPN